MKEITNYLHYLPSSMEPLSADVYIIEGEKNTYIFDVGNNREAQECIEGLPKEKIIILSHPHNDHVGNLDKLPYKTLYLGDATFEKLQKGTVVTDEVTIYDGVKIQIKACPSPHTGGSLIVTINNEFTLLADLYFTRPTYDKALAREMLSVLRTLDTKYFIASHQEELNLVEKETAIQEMSNYFQ